MKLSIIAFALLFSLSSTVYAKPKLIDIVGLIPGKSTKQDVQAVSLTPEDTVRVMGFYLIAIGGKELRCGAEFIDERLSSLTCLTGGRVTVDSNTLIHLDFLDGFTKKFGKPKSSVNIPLETSLGRKITSNMVLWQDELGNELELISVAGKAENGLVILRSFEQIKLNKQNQQAQEKKKNY